MTSSPNRLVGIIVGAIYLLFGALGFTVTAGIAPFAPDGELFLGVFEVNAFQNIVHVLLGTALLASGLSGVPSARTANSVIGTLYLALGIAGLFLIGTTVDILALNVADNVLHFGSAALLLAVGLGADKAPQPEKRTPEGGPLH